MNQAEKILVVEDEARARSSLCRILGQAGYECKRAANARSALRALEKETFHLVLTDIMLPGMDGRALLSHVKHRYPQTAVVIVTALVDVDTAVATLKDGAYDYLCKPFEPQELLMRVERALERRRLALSTWATEQALQGSIHEQLRQLQRVSSGGVQALVFALEASDPFTRGHSQRVADLALATAVQMGLSGEQAAHIHVAGLLHDVGKVAIKDAVLNKPGALTPEERAHVQTHAVEGARILRPLMPESDVVMFVRHHHESYDGRGYPDGLLGLKIPLGARILTVADAYDAMTSLRPYRPAFKKASAAQELKRCAGEQFDPQAVSAFHRALRSKAPSVPQAALPATWPWKID
jgi:putative nucleotidyltransferase with HDIG domain